VFRGRKVLSAVGRSWIKTTQAYLTKHYATELLLQPFLQPNVPYLLWLEFGTPELENAGFPKHAANRFKKFDVSNGVKLLEDVIVKLSGIDDAQNIGVLASKCYASEPRTDVRIYDLTGERPEIGVEP
jgi:hypothetical protein